MKALFALIEAVLVVVNSGADRVLCVPGTPVGITAVGGKYWVVSCVEPAGVFLLDRNEWTVLEYSGDFREPQGTGLLEGEPVVCDREANRLFVGLPGVSREVPLPGGPFAVTTVDWTGNGERTAVVTLRDSGQVALVAGDEAVVLAELPGARAIAAADTDGDGDEELLVACCGTGLHLVLNREEGGEPLVRRIGVLGSGVKGAASVDMDDDGDLDAVGIACAEGGCAGGKTPALWSRNGQGTTLTQGSRVPSPSRYLMKGSLWRRCSVRQCSTTTMRSVVCPDTARPAPGAPGASSLSGIARASSWNLQQSPLPEAHHTGFFHHEVVKHTEAEVIAFAEEMSFRRCCAA